MKIQFKLSLLATLFTMFGAQIQAQTANNQSLSKGASKTSDKGWELGAVLDVAHTNKPLLLGQREKGTALGHSDVVARGPLGQHFSAQIGAAVHSHDGKIEAELEEAWLQTRTLPAGLQLRAGRFASQIGYLNEQHPHADDFIERPLLYRAFLGGHWFDDGIRLNWTAPTPFYLNLGAEAFRGKQLVQEAVTAKKLGALTLTAKMGADLTNEHSWQLGLSHLINRREAAQESEQEDAGHDHSHDHSHAHGAQFSGRKTSMIDLTWKWAPNGNNRDQQVRVSAEWARMNDLNSFSKKSDLNEASSLSVVWRLKPSWEIGARTDRLNIRVPHGDHFHDGNLQENTAMIAWKPTHMQSLRLQYTKKQSTKGLGESPKNAVMLQYVLAFGAHGAHSF